MSTASKVLTLAIDAGAFIGRIDPGKDGVSFIDFRVNLEDSLEDVLKDEGVKLAPHFEDGKIRLEAVDKTTGKSLASINLDVLGALTEAKRLI